MNGLLIEAEQLFEQLNQPHLKIIDLTRHAVYKQLHVPHAIHVMPNQLVEPQELASGYLPCPEKMQALIVALQLSPQDYVVAYDDEGGAWAGRFIWNLHCIGFNQTAVLNGGLHAWLAGQYPVSNQKHIPLSSLQLFTPHFLSAQHHRIQYKTLKRHVDEQSIQIWDCRSKDEYTGQKQTARLAGHIPNAIHYEWNTALDKKNHLKLRPLNDIRQELQQAGFDFTKPVVVYCQSHHRSGLAYILGRLLNWQVYAYDGAWSEWGNHLQNPIVMGEKPL